MMREKIIKKLAGSTAQHPVSLEDLKSLSPDDTQHVYEEIESLFSAHIINRASCYKEGKNFLLYWLTGQISPALPFSITGAQFPPRSQIVQRAEVQPNTANFNFILEDQVKVNTTPANIAPVIVKKQASELTKAIFNQVVLSPGISGTKLKAFALAEFPESNLKKITKTIWNLVSNSKRIYMEGKGADATYHMVNKTHRPDKIKIAKKPAEKLIVGVEAQKIAADTAPNKRPAATVKNTFDDFNFAFGRKNDGSILISKDGNQIILTPAETLLVKNFI
jgi:hypothetical protein